MRKTRPWLYGFLPLLYLGVVLVLIVVQFTKKSDSFSQSLGGMTVSGKTSSGGQPVDLQVRGRGLEFAFNANRTLMVVQADGSTTPVRPTSWAFKDGNIQVVFERGYWLTIGQDPTNNRVQELTFSVPPGTTPVQTVRLPFAAEGGSQLTIHPQHPLIEIQTGGNHLMASLDGAQDQVADDGYFVIRQLGSGFRPLRIEPLPAGLDAFHYWLVQDFSTQGVEQAKTALTQYWDKAYQNWGNERLRSGQGGWVMADGSVRFSSQITDAWSREALLRGDYQSVNSRILSLENQSGASWGFEAMSYLGNLMDLTLSQRRRVEADVARTQPDWTGRYRLWLDARFYGPEGAADRLETQLLAGDLPTDTAALVGFFANVLLLKENRPTLEGLDARISAIRTSLTHQLTRQENQVYAQTPEHYFDLKTGLILGRLFIRSATLVPDELMNQVGAQLILTALGHQADTALIPEILITDAGRIVRQEGGFYPEEVYSIVKPAFVEETPLSPPWPSPALVRTVAKLTNRSITASQARFTFDFPVGTAQHLIITGVPPFESIQLHGIRWRTDPQFQAYTDGWYYSASTQTLYVKVKHRDDKEELVINF